MLLLSYLDGPVLRGYAGMDIVERKLEKQGANLLNESCTVLRNTEGEEDAIWASVLRTPKQRTPWYLGCHVGAVVRPTRQRGTRASVSST